MVDYLPLEALTPGLKNTFWAICSFAYGNLTSCFPSVEAIGERAGCSSRTVGVHVRRLASLGILIVVRKGRRNYYILPHKVKGQSWGKAIAKQVADLPPEVHEYKTLKQFLAEERAKPKFTARELRRVREDIRAWGRQEPCSVK